MDKILERFGEVQEALLIEALGAKVSTAYSPIARGRRARGCKTSIAQPTSRRSPSQPGHVVRACR